MLLHFFIFKSVYKFVGEVIDQNEVMTTHIIRRMISQQPDCTTSGDKWPTVGSGFQFFGLVGDFQCWSFA